jgi:two-component system, OmpR family, alkaline phosphatase synthesis response regulator PhoP
MKHRILLVEDEPGLVVTLTDRLQGEGYEVVSREDGEGGLAQALESSYDLVILDVMLPGMDGFELCRRLREGGAGVPVLMLTARVQTADKVAGLKTGADDYVTKPFEMTELLARIEALLRRTPVRRSEPRVFCFDNISVDFRRSEVSRDNLPIPLSAREFQLLAYLIDRRGQDVSRDDLLADVWGYQDLPTTRTVDVHMAWLRQKLEENPKIPRYLLTVRGVGYRFDEREA